MTDRPIIFSASMVKALLEGRKSQTRRVLKLPKRTHSGGPIYERPDMGGWAATTIGGGGCFTIGRDGRRLPVPERPAIWHQTTGVVMALPFDVGDRLWVREAFRGSKDYDAYPPREWSHWPVHYEADGAPDPRDEVGENGKLRSPIHMPLWASRLTLTVTDVRVERLQEISEEDAFEEGVTRADVPLATWRASYRTLWNSLHGPDAWDANPWVAAISFTVSRGNIDGGAA